MSDNEMKKDKGVVKKYLAKKYDQMLDTILVAAENQIALKPKDELVNNTEQEVGMALSEVESNAILEHAVEAQIDGSSTISNKELLHHVASTLLNTSIDQIRLNKDGKQPLVTPEDTLDTIPSPRSSPQDKFVDLFLERLLSRMITDKLPEREHLTDTTELPGGQKGKPISPAILASNLGKMTGQMNGIFEFQDSLIRLLTWKIPSSTIMTLLIVTLILYYPIYLILLPLTYIAYGLIIANYNKKYRLRNTSYHLKKTYGESLLKKITSGGKPSKPKVKPIMEQLNDDIEDIVDWEDTSTGLQVITNLRDLQNMTTNTLHLTDSITAFINETVAFKDEKKTTILFLKCFSGYFILKVLSPWVNWKLLFSSLIWMVFLNFHPKLRPKIRRFKARFKHKKDSTPPTDTSAKKDSIIIDVTPLSREIEVFEIQRKGLIPGEWKFFMYSSNVFDYNDEYRKAQKPPPGVKELEDVNPPTTWKFDMNTKWEIDYNVVAWSQQKGLPTTSEIEDEFYCDNMFKRRRLIRRVLK